MRMPNDAVNSAANPASMIDGGRGHRWVRRLIPGALAIAIAAVLLLAAGPFGWRLGLLHYRIAFSMLMPWSFYCGLAAAGLAVIGLLAGLWAGVGAGASPRRHVLTAAIAFLIGGAVAYMPWHYDHMRGSVPRINDITTDTENPPQFQAVLPVRKAADANPITYDAKTAEQQRNAYPDIAPLIVDVPPKAAFERALATAEKLNWTIVASDPAAGHIEASQSSRWFGFTDDVAIRVAAAGAGSRVDIRSVSRYGRGDFGVNAARVRAFLAAFRAAGRAAGR
jgi:uncharacterized protein (DUF1499 family)